MRQTDARRTPDWVRAGRTPEALRPLAAPGGGSDNCGGGGTPSLFKGLSDDVVDMMRNLESPRCPGAFLSNICARVLRVSGKDAGPLQAEALQYCTSNSSFAGAALLEKQPVSVWPHMQVNPGASLGAVPLQQLSNLMAFAFLRCRRRCCRDCRVIPRSCDAARVPLGTKASNRQTCRQADMQTGRQADRQTCRQADMQTF